MFLLNSRHPLVCAPRQRLPADEASLSRSYGGKLPSSFSIILSSALVYSTSPPVSVSGTVSCGGYFLEPRIRPVNPIRPDEIKDSSPSTGCGIFTAFPSTTLFSLALGAD